MTQNLTNPLVLIFVLSALLFQCDTPSSARKNGVLEEKGKLIWSDEFEEEGAPNPENWTYDLGHGHNGWGNREIQEYTDKAENVRVENGRLIIDVIKDKSGQWTSGRVKSQGLQQFQYGRIEFRAKLPAGVGTWSALWLLGENFVEKGWPACGEIDVMEHVGRDHGTIHSVLHTSYSHGDSHTKGITKVEDCTTTFHVYSVDWTPEAITFSVDDVPHYVYSPEVKNEKNWPFDAPFFLIMNIAMGGTFGSHPDHESDGKKNGIDPNLTHSRMEVDYVRVYDMGLTALGE